MRKNGRTILGVFAMCVFSAMLMSCATPPEGYGQETTTTEETGDVSIKVDTSALSVDIIDETRIWIYSSEAAYQEFVDHGTADPASGFPVELAGVTGADGVYTATGTGIPVGTDRYFVAIAYDGTSPVFIGYETADIDVSGVAVNIMMHEVNTNQDIFRNTAPRITHLAISDGSILVTETAKFVATIYDPDPGTTGMILTWTFAQGNHVVDTAAVLNTLSTTETVTWTSPAVADNCDLVLRVTDGYGLSTELSFVDIIEVLELGDVTVTATANTAPKNINLVAEPASMGVGVIPDPVATLTVSFTDEATDTHTYFWVDGDGGETVANGCRGEFTTTVDEKVVLYNLDDSQYGALMFPGYTDICTLGVHVEDQEGNESSAFITIVIGTPGSMVSYGG